MNGYRVTVTRLEDAWTLTAVKSIDPDPADTIVLADGLTFGWQFADKVAPNPLEPATLEFKLAGRDATVLPVLDTGDLWHVLIELVDVTGDLVTPLGADAVNYTGRLGEPELELVPGHSWPIRATLRLTDLLADLASRYPTAGYHPYKLGTNPFTSPDWFDWFIETAARREFNLWTHLDMANEIKLNPSIPQLSARGILDAVGASLPSAGQPFVIRDRYSLAPPVGPEYHPAGYDGIPDPTTPVGFLYQRLNDMPAASALPYKLTGPAAGPIDVLLDYDPAGAAGLAGIPASVVTIPTRARRARDLVPNTTVVTGQGRLFTGPGQTELFETSISYSTDWAAPKSRSVTTLIDYLQAPIADGVTIVDAIGFFDFTAAAIDRNLRPTYTPDVAATSAEWAYDDLTVDALLLEPGAFAALVPMFTSWSPELGDGVPRRPVMVYDVDPDVDLSGRQAINGTLTGATLRIERGRMTYTLNVSPGIAQPDPAGGSQITAAQLAAGPYSAAPATAFGDLTALDMRLTRA